jgi:hypothetical protein
MRLRAGLVFAIFLTAAVSAHANGIVVFDNFSCADSVGVTGAAGFNDNVITCPGSLGGEREDFLLVSGGSGGSVSTLSSNPPSGAITGTFGAGIDEYEGMVWGNVATNPLNLDLSGDSVLVQIQSNSGGTLTAGVCPSLTDNSCNGDSYSVAFSGNPGYQDVFIPLTNPVVVGSGGSLADANILNVYLSLNNPGSTFTIDGVESEAPEPSTLLLLAVGILGAGSLRVLNRTRRAE